jgi:KDO2-lipid IV(A) lauroyltransferase
MRDAIYSLRGFKAAFLTAHVFPRALCQWLSARIGLAAYARSAEAQSALRANLALVTGLCGGDLDALCAENVANFSRMLADYFLCAGPDATEQAAALLHGRGGVEHLTAAREQGNGAIVVTGHLGHWELGGLMLARHGLPLTVITLEEPSTELTRWREACRRQLGIKTITVGPGHPFAFVEMIQTLRRNEFLAMLVDRPYSGTGTSVQFFGHETQFSTAPALLHQHTGAAVLPAFVLQDGQGGYLTMAEPLIPMTNGTDSQAALTTNTQRIANIFEGIIRRHPEQWFNYVPIWKDENPSIEVPDSSTPVE